MSLIPKTLIHIWGFKDDGLSQQASDNRKKALEILGPEWSLVLLRPPDVLRLPGIRTSALRLDRHHCRGCSCEPSFFLFFLNRCCWNADLQLNPDK